jgi:2,3,4,5-tetrahydropyridine-2,6-dicarboxylate N-succinyltransferase
LKISQPCHSESARSGDEEPAVPPLTNQQSAINNQQFMSALKSSIERLATLGEIEQDPEVRKTFLEFRDQLTQGKIRAAEKVDGRWTVNAWVKQGILLGFRLGALADMTAGLSFVDKDTFPARQFTLTDRVRVVPGGSSVRTGAYVAPSVICMPPMFINVGAYVDDGTMIDSHALVGSCAQIGKRVHLSAAAQVGGVLEPVNAAPVIIEDDVLVGGNCGIYEGTLVRARAVLGAGTILTRSTPLYDLVRGEVYRATPEAPLEVPEDAVVVPGSRAVKKERGPWGCSARKVAGGPSVATRSVTRRLPLDRNCARFTL